MGRYNFNKDLKQGNETEVEVKKLLESRGFIISKFGKMKRAYDFAITKNGLTLHVEVKEDYACGSTGNVAIEYMSRGELSGISSTGADVYIYKIHEPDGQVNFYMIPVRTLLEMIGQFLFVADVRGGDRGSDTHMYLFKLKTFKAHATLLEAV